MFKILYILLLFFFTSHKGLSNEQKTSELLYEFDGICVKNIHNIQRIRDNAKVLNWKILPKEIESFGAPDVKGPGFAMWAIDKGNKKFNFVGVNDAENVNSCTLVSVDAKIDEVHEMLKTVYRLKLKYKDLKSGFQEYWIYEINILNADKTYLFLTYSKDKNNPYLNMTILSNYLIQGR
jgi:hypothetical protein